MKQIIYRIFSFLKIYSKNKTYIIIYEAGSNKMAGCALFVTKGSVIVSANSMEEAIEKSSKTSYGDYKLFHYGHSPHYQIIIDVKKI